MMDDETRATNGKPEEGAASVEQASSADPRLLSGAKDGTAAAGTVQRVEGDVRSMASVRDAEKPNPALPLPESRETTQSCATPCAAGTPRSTPAALPQSTVSHPPKPIPPPENVVRPKAERPTTIPMPPPVRRTSPVKQPAASSRPDHSADVSLLLQQDPAMTALLQQWVLNGSNMVAAAERIVGGSGTRPAKVEKPFDPEDHRFGKDGQTRMVWDKARPVVRRNLHGKDIIGFASLPPNLLRYIFTLALEDVKPSEIVQRQWAGQPSEALVLAGIQRKWLVTMRLICVPWTIAVEAHPFWARWMGLHDARVNGLKAAHDAAIVISKPFASRDRRYFATCRPKSLQEIYSAPRTPRPLYHSVRSHALKMCIPCKINRPPPHATFIPDRRETVATHALGWVGMCTFHSRTWCHHCFCDHPGYDFDDNGRTWQRPMGPHQKDPGFAESVRGDTDEKGELRRLGATICHDCRMDGMEFQLQKLLEECAAGGPIRGLEDIENAQLYTVPGQGYLKFGRGTAERAARLALEQRWLERQGKWQAAFDHALACHRIELQFRKHIRQFGLLPDEDRVLAKNRMAHLISMWGSQDGLAGNWRWQAEMELREIIKQSESDWEHCDEDEEYEMDEEDLYEEAMLSDRWWIKTRDATMLDWVRDRIKIGFWVSPSDEVSQLSNPPTASSIHTPLLEIAKKARSPFPEDQRYTPQFGYQVHLGYIRLEPLMDDMEDEDEAFLPPPRLLMDLDTIFADKLVYRLRHPVREIVKGIMHSFDGDVEKTWAYCRGMKGNDVLERLRGRAAWYDGGTIWAQHNDLAEIDDLEEGEDERVEDFKQFTQAANAALESHERNGRDTEDQAAAKAGPRIEFIEVEQPEEEDNAFGIKEVTPSSPRSMGGSENGSETEDEIIIEPMDIDVPHGGGIDGPTAEPTSLGKRKAAPDGAESGDQRAGKERKSESPREAQGSGERINDANDSSPEVTPEMPTTAVMSETGTRGTSETSSAAVPVTPDDFTDDLSGDAIDRLDSKDTDPTPKAVKVANGALSPAFSKAASSPLSDMRSTPEYEDEEEEEFEEVQPSPLSPIHEDPDERQKAPLGPITKGRNIDERNFHGLKFTVKLGYTDAGIAARPAQKAREPKPGLIIDTDFVPWIPGDFDDLGPGAQGLIMKLWEDTWTKLAVLWETAEAEERLTGPGREAGIGENEKSFYEEMDEEE